MDPYNNLFDFIEMTSGRQIGKSSLQYQLIDQLMKKETTMSEDLSRFVSIVSGKIYEQVHNLKTNECPEEDTYTLIPNGTELTDKQGTYPKKEICAYLVQHDQSGLTIKWQGESPIWYTSTVYQPEFDTFVDWDKQKRRKWKTDQLKLLKKKETTMYDDDEHCECALCVPCIPATPYTAKYNSIPKSAKKETAMNIAASTIVNSTPTDQRQRDYLIGRLDNIYYEKSSELYTFFKLDPVAGPATFKELIEKIKSDDFTIDEKFLDRRMGTYSMMDYIRWTKDKPDQAGYDKAIEELKKTKQATKDLIIISEPKDGLKALNDFEAKTFH